MRALELSTGERIPLTQHAVDRYGERVCPAVPPWQQLEHLRRLAAAVGVLRAAEDTPCWLAHARDEETRAEAWVMLGPDVALLVRDGCAITVLARGGMSPMARASRNEHRKRVQARRWRRGKEGSQAQRQEARRERRDAMQRAA